MSLKQKINEVTLDSDIKIGVDISAKELIEHLRDSDIARKREENKRIERQKTEAKQG